MTTIGRSTQLQPSHWGGRCCQHWSHCQPGPATCKWHRRDEMSIEVSANRLELLLEIVPKAHRVAYLYSATAVTRAPYARCSDGAAAKRRALRGAPRGCHQSTTTLLGASA